MTKRAWILTILILTATLLRLHNISSHTEFLADQGSAASVIYESVRDREIPLVGPAISTGQRPGPLFYYLIALPLIATGYNPVAPAVLFAFFGIGTVVLLYFLGERLFGKHIGFVVAILFAVSPLVVAQGRNVWNPNPIPFLVTAVLFAMYKVFEDKKYAYLALIGVINGGLVQLHYTNVYTIAVSVLFVFYLWYRKKDYARKDVVKWSAWGVLGFVGMLSPLIIYEIQHGFANIRNLFLTVFLPDLAPTTPQVSGSRPSTLNLSTRVFWYVAPITKQWAMVFFQTLLLGLPIAICKKWFRLYAMWFIGGIFTVGLFSGAIGDHYLNFIEPLPFLLFGGVLVIARRYIRQWNSQLLWILVPIAITPILMNIVRLDVFREGLRDVPRVEAMTQAIIDEADGEPFSFTMLPADRSFSDYHYRFYFQRAGYEPVEITDRDYPRLFVICEDDECPSEQALSEMDTFRAMCYDKVCVGEYPLVFMDDWAVVTSEHIEHGMLYSLERVK